MYNTSTNKILTLYFRGHQIQVSPAYTEQWFDQISRGDIQVDIKKQYNIKNNIEKRTKLSTKGKSPYGPQKTR